jgi:CheY-like chemotaxis protein
MPEGKQFSDAVLEAARQQAEDPARLAQWIAQLQDPSLPVRSRAMSELRRGGSSAVLALIAVLADEGRAAEHAMVRDALAAMRSAARDPLVAVLDSESDPLKVQAADVLRRLGTADPAVYLVGPAHSPNRSPELQAAARRALTQMLGHVPDLQAAAGMMYTRAKTEYDRSALIRDQADPVIVWRWDVAAGLPAAQEYPPHMASLLEAVRLAKPLYELLPESPVVRRLYLGSLLELSAYEAGRDEPLPTGAGTPHDAAAAMGVEELEQVLAHSTITGHVAAATAAVQILGEIGSQELLHNRGPRPTLLVDAALHPDRRLRFAAVSAIMNLTPDRVYPGSSQVLSSLLYFAGSAGQRRALVLDTHLQEATRLAGLLMQMGFEVDVTTQPRDLLERAVAWPDYELALVDFNLPRTNVDELVQMLRHDHRARLLPLLYVTSSAEDQRAARYVAEHLSHVDVMVRPVDLAGMEVQVNRFLAKTGANLLPPELRLQQAQQAIAWLAAMAAQPAPLYNVQRAAQVAEAALVVPELAPQAAMLLADLGTAGSQQALVGLANRATVPLELRRTAAQAFRHSVHKHGVLLTSDEMLYQYDRYNGSETEPAESQEVLASILDTLETGRNPEGGQ